jgi:CRP-like cAMP-binding protein
VPPESNQETVRKFLSHLPLFQALTPHHLDEIAADAKEIRLEKGATLFHRGDASTGFHVVVFGQLQLSINSPQGGKKIVEIIGPQQSLGEAVMFLSRPYPVSCGALTDSLVVHVASESVNRLLAADPTFARLMLAGLSVRLHSLLHDVESYSLRSSTQRVIGYLLQQCPADEGQDVEVELPTSKLVIASRLNLTPETLSRVFSDLSRLNLIEVKGRTIAIPDVKVLREHDL